MARAGIIASLGTMLWLASGCKGGETQKAEDTHSLEKATSSARDAAPTADAASAPAPEPHATPRDGEWRGFVRNDEVPVCVFENWLAWQDANFIEQVKPNVALRAGHAINFGVFGPGCVSSDCVQDAMLQCWTEVEGSIITLHSKYSGSEKVGATACSENCIAAAAQCNTPLLPKGNYEVVYGSDRWKLRLPGVVKSPCWKR